MDPTSKKNQVKEGQILINFDGSHPKENYGWEIRGREQTTNVELTLTLGLRRADLKVVPPPPPTTTTTTLTILWPVGFASGKKSDFPEMQHFSPRSIVPGAIWTPHKSSRLRWPAGKPLNTSQLSCKENPVFCHASNYKEFFYATFHKYFRVVVGLGPESNWRDRFFCPSMLKTFAFFAFPTYSSCDM